MLTSLGSAVGALGSAFGELLLRIRMSVLEASHVDRAGAVEATRDRTDLLGAGARLDRKRREAEQEGRSPQREREAHVRSFVRRAISRLAMAGPADRTIGGGSR